MPSTRRAGIGIRNDSPPCELERRSHRLRVGTPVEDELACTVTPGSVGSGPSPMRPPQRNAALAAARPLPRASLCGRRTPLPNGHSMTRFSRSLAADADPALTRRTLPTSSSPRTNAAFVLRLTQATLGFLVTDPFSRLLGSAGSGSRVFSGLMGRVGLEPASGGLIETSLYAHPYARLLPIATILLFAPP
jgi:hypothetical protein